MIRKIGKLYKTEEDDYQLQYNQQDNRKYEVVESSSVYKRFSTMKDALSFVDTNEIILEDTDLDNTVSFSCPNCEKKGNKSWAIKRDSGGFLCPRCGNSYHSRESAWENYQ